ncbi:diaminopimelate dehydrogenase [Clostridium paraputrificum]|uniref:diaminopimelate dehydrogenase n=1 Tax=Clostridium paraputrificum TaxID=29363 RepID=UPI000EA38696|nr:diaminopimelate dehydrogenase [Clostridium paraputrificum]RKI48438.1 diaminopimelate dehydrogenase [Clostridium paraputrificum]
MENKIRVGIVGYGNLGKGVRKAINQNKDIELEAIFTRREVSKVSENDNLMVHISKIGDFKDRIDVMILCGGSATDLVEQGPMVAEMFNTVDSFDTHAKIPSYFEKMNEVSTASGNLSIISVGWDPGLFSLNRLLGNAVLPNGKDYTFWGKGVSQGHSDAIRRIQGVKNGIQYTIPIEDALERVRSGENPDLTTREKHLRECFVVAEEGADKTKIEEEIKNMPNYFSDYDTTVHFITEEELKREHSGMPHGGFVIRTGETGEGTKQRIEFSLDLGSNPEFTSSILVAYARAIAKMAKEGKKGALTVFDVPFGYLSSKTPAELRKELL